MSAHDPADCHVCGDRANGAGIGFSSRNDKDPKWLCVDCSHMIDDIKRMKRPDAYKLKAREGGVEAARPYFEQHGYDLSEWDAETRVMFVGSIWDGCSKRLRELIRTGEAPF